MKSLVVKTLQFKKDDEKTFLSELDELKNQENTKNISIFDDIKEEEEKSIFRELINKL